MWDFMGGALGGLFGYKGAKDQQVASAKQAQQQMDFQERMSNTAHQRQMADMRKAGLNPILSAKYGGASSPAGQQAPVPNKMERALNSAQQVANISKTIADTQWVENKTGMTAFLGSLGTNIEQLYNYMINSASKAGKEFRDSKEPKKELTMTSSYGRSSSDEDWHPHGGQNDLSSALDAIRANIRDLMKKEEY